MFDKFGEVVELVALLLRENKDLIFSIVAIKMFSSTRALKNVIA